MKRNELYSLKIFIENLTFACILGILEHERQNPQEVIITITIEYAFEKSCYIDYAEVAQLVKNRMQNKQFLLIEDALQDIKMHLKNKFSKISTLSLKITKPSILPDCMVSVAETTEFDS